MEGRKSVGLALGSGAYKGLAHIGVLEVLQEERIPVDMIAGSSIGAMVGGAYCAGNSPHVLEKLVLSLNERNFYDFVAPRLGFIKGEKAQAFIKQLTADMNIEDMPLPFAAVACDMNSGETVVFREGKAHEAIRGSISVPGVFLPHEYGPYRLIDGGVVDRVPVRAARAMGAQVVIAVDVGYRGGASHPKNIMDVLMYAVEIGEWRRMEDTVSTADVQIVPNLEGVSGSTLQNAAQAIRAGREAALAALEDIRRAVE